MYSSCKVPDIHAYQAQVQKTPRNGRFVPAKDVAINLQVIFTGLGITLR